MKLRQLLVLVILFSPGLSWGQSLTVWPGDANNNGEANHLDLLYLGLNYGLSGPGRNTISTAWTGFSAISWSSPVGGPFDGAYSDCNGDSTVNMTDIQAIDQNFGLQHGTLFPDSSSISNLVTDPLLGFDFPNDSLPTGSIDTVSLELGTFIRSVDSLYGIGFTITYDTSLVDSMYFLWDNSWLATGASPFLSFEHYAPGTLYVSGIRTDRLDRTNGVGSLGGIVIVMDDNLKTHASSASLKMEIPQVLALNTQGNVKRVSPVSDSVVIYLGKEPLIPATDIRLFPVPAQEYITIEVPGKSPALQGKLLLTAPNGAILRIWKFNGRQKHLNLSGMPSGLYMLHLVSDQGTAAKKIMIQR